MALYETLRITPPLLAPTHRVAVLSTVGRARRGTALLDLGLGDALTRAMSSRTGRTCELAEVELHDGVDGPSADAVGYDAIAITISVTDSTGSAPPTGWQQALRALLEAVLPSIPPGTPIVVGVPVTRPAAASHTLRARLVERSRYRFTNEVATILNGFGRGELVALPLTGDRFGRALGPADTERVADALADRLAPRLLQAGHDAAARRLKLSA
jgi:hypothetical protein